jgi:AcrR family transcriptional regulator
MSDRIDTLCKAFIEWSETMHPVIRLAKESLAWATIGSRICFPAVCAADKKFYSISRFTEDADQEYCAMALKGPLQGNVRKPGRPKDAGLAERRRGEIVTRAIGEFAHSGYAGADLDVIAANAGCSKGTLYNYFPSKGDLFNASVDHVMFSVMKACEVGEDVDPIDQLEQVVHGFLAHFAGHPQHVELLMQERSDFRDRKEPTYLQYKAASRRRWQKRFERLMAQGRMRKMSAERAIDILASLLYGTVFLNYFNYFRRGGRSNPKQQARELLNVFLGGLLTEAEYLSRKPPV